MVGAPSALGGRRRGQAPCCAPVRSQLADLHTFLEGIVRANELHAHGRLFVAAYANDGTPSAPKLGLLWTALLRTGAAEPLRRTWQPVAPSHAPPHGSHAAAPQSLGTEMRRTAGEIWWWRRTFHSRGPTVSCPGARHYADRRAGEPRGPRMARDSPEMPASEAGRPCVSSERRTRLTSLALPEIAARG